MKTYGTVSNSSANGKEDAPLLSKSHGTKSSSSNFKRIGVATLLASGAAFAIASSSNRISTTVGSSAMRLGDALDDAKAGALLKFF